MKGVLFTLRLWIFTIFFGSIAMSLWAMISESHCDAGGLLDIAFVMWIVSFICSLPGFIITMIVAFIVDKNTDHEYFKKAVVVICGILAVFITLMCLFDKEFSPNNLGDILYISGPYCLVLIVTSFFLTWGQDEKYNADSDPAK